MSGSLLPLRSGEKITVAKINAIIDEITRLHNIQASQGSGLRVTNTAAGIFIDKPPHILIVDDKYLIDAKYNQSEAVKRLCDEKLADIGDVWRIRAVSSSVPSIGSLSSDESYGQFYKLMWLINRFNESEGGWMTDSAHAGLSLTEGDAALHEVATPKRNIGQIGDVLLLCEGDLISTTADGDIQCYTNIRHDAHFFYKTEAADGRIFFTTNPPGMEGVIQIKGEMILDPALADFDTELKKESGEWRPQIGLPLWTYTPPDTPPWEPTDDRVTPPPVGKEWTTDTIIVQEFPAGSDVGFKGSMQTAGIPIDPATADFYPLRLYIEYGALGDIADKTFVMKMTYNVVPEGSEISAAADEVATSIITVPAGQTQTTVCSDYIEIPTDKLEENALIIIKEFKRDTGNASDNFPNSVEVCAYKTAWGE